MRVLWLVHYPVFSGPHNRILRLHRALATAGVEVSALVPAELGDAAERLRAGGVDVYEGPLHRVRATRAIRPHVELLASFRAEVAALRGLIRRIGADAVVIGGLVNPHGALAGHLEQAAVVWQVIDTRTPLAARRTMMPVAERLADAFMFGGQRVMDLHLDGHGTALPAFVSVPPVDVDRFVPSADRRAATRAQWGVPEDAPLVGTVANINPQKGIEWFVRAAAQIHREAPGSHFVVVGGRYDTHRDYAAAIDRELASSGIPRERFRFAGARPDVEAVYPALDVKLISSVPRSEGTTTTGLEAMACGVPVVAADVGAVAEVVADGETGIVVPPLDARALARASLGLLRDPARRAALGAAGRSRVVSRYSVDCAAEVHAAALDAAIEHRRAR